MNKNYEINIDKKGIKFLGHSKTKKLPLYNIF